MTTRIDTDTATGATDRTRPTRATLAALVVILVVSALVAPLASAGAAGDYGVDRTLAPGEAGPLSDDRTDGGGANLTDDVAPGERVAGVLGGESARYEGDLENRLLEVELDPNRSVDERVQTLVDRYELAVERADLLERQYTELLEASEDGDVTIGAFRARLIVIDERRAATTDAIDRLVEEETRLPSDRLDGTALDDDALSELEARLDDLDDGIALERTTGGAVDWIGTPWDVTNRFSAWTETLEDDDTFDDDHSLDEEEGTFDDDESVDDDDDETADDDDDAWIGLFGALRGG